MPLSNFEQEHARNMNIIERAIQRLYDSADFEMIAFVRTTFRNTANYTDNPLFQKKLQDIEARMHDSILQLIGTGVNNANAISAAKSHSYIASLFQNRKAYEIVLAKEFNTTNGAATQYFSQRAQQGFDISARVWDITGQKKAEIAESVQAAIDSGVSADNMSREIKKYLNAPDKVFRRVRNEAGQLVESQARKDYHPGQGVYKESKANAFRLSRTEINGSYRSADQQRWQQQDFVIGYRVKLSNNPNHCPFCEGMQGDYPKTFVFFGFHPSCRCSCVPILLTKDEYSKYEDYLLGIGDKPEINYIEHLQPSVSSFIKSNAEMINGWSNKPYWAKDNPTFVDKLLKTK